MVMRASPGQKIADVIIHIVLIGAALLCLAPLVNVLAVSFSSRPAADAGFVTFWPVEFTLNSYQFIVTRSAFAKAFLVSLQRVLLGTGLDMLLIVLVAYPLSKESSSFKMRTVYAWVFFFTALFGGGLIPTYMTVRATGIIDSIWALVLPVGVPVFNVVLMLNFFRTLPRELEESAAMDGAGHVRILFRIFIPLSPAAIATITLFTAVFHWNSWFDGMIYMNSPQGYPLQTYLQATIMRLQSLLNSATQDSEMQLIMDKISDRTARAAQIFAGALPIILAYPFLQRYFVKGMVLGSVKQ
jgi:putative aldouronate transport system permease protein